MKSILFATLAFVILAGAAPSDSGYSNLPKKVDQYGSNQDAQVVRDSSVSPESVYKYGVQEVSLIATDTGYIPKRIYVRKNIPVHLFLTSASPEKLCFVMDEFSIRRGVAIQQVEQVNFLAKKAGEFKFYCPVKEISGSIVVRD